MDLHPHLDIHLNALPEVLAACQDADIDQITLLLNGRWTVRKLGQVRRQHDTLTETELSGLRRAISKHGQGIAAQLGWHFRQHASAEGWIVVGERLPAPDAGLIPDAAQRALKQVIERGANGLLIGPPGSHKAHILAWIAQQFVHDQIVLVSDLPPREPLGPRIIHLYPPQDRAQARSFSRFLSQCDAVLWDRVLHSYDLQDCLSHAGAKRRWMTFDAQDADQGIEAFSRLWQLQHWATLDAVLLTDIPSPSTPAITGLCTRERERWQPSMEQPERFTHAVQAAFNPSSWPATAPAAPAAPAPPAAEPSPPRPAPAAPRPLPPAPPTALKSPQEQIQQDTRPEISSPELLRITGIHDPRQAASSTDIFEDSEGSLTRSAEFDLELESSPEQELHAQSASQVEEADSAQTVNSPAIESLIDDDVRDIAQRAIMTPSTLEIEVMIAQANMDEPMTQDLSLDEDSAGVEAWLKRPLAPSTSSEDDDIWVNTQEYVQENTSPQVDQPRHILERTDVEHTSPESPSIWSSARAEIPHAPKRPSSLQLTDESSLLEFELPDPPEPSAPEELSREETLDQERQFKVEADDDITNNVARAQLQDILPPLAAETSPSIASPINALMVDPLDTSEEDDVLLALDSLYADPPTPSKRAAPQDDLRWEDDDSTLQRVVSAKKVPHLLQTPSRTPPPAPHQAQPVDPNTSSMSLRMNHLSERLKALRQQRLATDPPPEDDGTATPDETTQVTIINLNEVEAIASAQDAAKRKHELLRKLRQDPDDH